MAMYSRRHLLTYYNEYKGLKGIKKGILRTNNNKLSAPLIETIATHWKREGIETAVEAMNLAEKQIF